MNLGFPEMIFLFVLALLIFGPKKLPEIGRQVGKFMNEFKRASNEFKAQIENEINQIELENERKEREKVRTENESEPKILPPAEPPEGAIAALPGRPGPVIDHKTEPILNDSTLPDPVLKAPNA